MGRPSLTEIIIGVPALVAFFIAMSGLWSIVP